MAVQTAPPPLFTPSAALLWSPPCVVGLDHVSTQHRGTFAPLSPSPRSLWSGQTRQNPRLMAKSRCKLQKPRLWPKTGANGTAELSKV